MPSSNASHRFSLALVVAAATALAATGCSSSAKGVPVTCDPDLNEGNDTEAAAKTLPELRDDPDSRGGVTKLTIHRDADEDWFKVPIRDTGFGGDPIITAAVSSRSFTVSTWFVCANKRRGDVSCSVGDTASDTTSDGSQGCRGKDIVPGDDIGIDLEDGVAVTSTTDCPGTSDDDGTLYIRVRRVSSFGGACGYDLDLVVR
ncbi:MAG: hypothetical protein JST00_16875 [Deltaproteobacteria bacterium]|nr:hypothetical protein [Deltaproteobacteria bacterium]